MSALPSVKESKSAATIRRRRHVSTSSTKQRPTDHTSRHEGDVGEDPEPKLKDFKILPKSLQLLMSSEKTLFLGLLAYRVVNALVVQTSFVPDEYWQSIEVAHKMAFGYGHLTWEWQQGLRSYTYPTMFAVVYKILGILRLDYRILLIKLPRVMQAVFAALGDFYLFKLSWKLSNQQVALWSLFCQLTSWFTFYCATRTLTNSMETVLTTVALYFFPWPDKPRKALWKYMFLVALAVVIRPTAAIVWIPLCAWHVVLHHRNLWTVSQLFVEIGFMVLLLSSVLDRICYGEWINVHYNFLEFNVLSGLGAFYGSHPWHWYLSQGFLVALGTHVFPFMLGAVKAMEKVLLAVIFWTIGLYSLLEHKEFRFLFPILPMAMHICGRYLHFACDSEETVNNHGITRRKFAVVLLIATNLPLALYTSLLHQRGTVDVMKYIHDESFRNDPYFMDVLYLMPCHSTPYYSYVHRNVSMQFLTCEPNLVKDPEYVDEADMFYAHPESWLKQAFPTGVHHVPSHLVMFDELQPKIKTFLDWHGYIDCGRFFHTHVPEGRVSSYVIVKCQVEWKISSSMRDMITARADQYKSEKSEHTSNSKRDAKRNKKHRKNPGKER